jgi:hypothetical protein
MGSNGQRRPPRPRLEIVSTGASEAEAAAIVAGIEQFLADTAPAPGRHEPATNRWQRAALEDGISARQISGAVWGHGPRRDTPSRIERSARPPETG